MDVVYWLEAVAERDGIEVVSAKTETDGAVTARIKVSQEKKRAILLDRAEMVRNYLHAALSDDRRALSACLDGRDIIAELIAELRGGER